jgi:DNA mismatch endonuclease (patch repair protein)
MADVVTPGVRSTMMSGIRGKNTQPELILRRGLFGCGVRYRLHLASLPGRPDIVIRKYNVAVMVHGCFWHAHRNCRYFRYPRGNRQFWVDKLTNNRKRDARSISVLTSAGWRVVVVWECAIRADSQAVLDSLHEFLTGNQAFLEIVGGKAGVSLNTQFQKPKAK